MEEINFSLESLRLEDFPSAKLKVDQLFREWLCGDGHEMVELLLSKMLEAAVSGDIATISSVLSDDVMTNLPHSINSNAIPPGPAPRSPTKKSPKKRKEVDFIDDESLLGDVIDINGESECRDKIEDGKGSVAQMNARRRVEQEKKRFESIPPFYSSGLRLGGTNGSTMGISRKGRVEEDQLENRQSEIEAFFKPYPTGIPVDKFVHATKRLCCLPSFFNLPLCKRICDTYDDDNPSIGSIAGGTGGALRSTAGVRVKLKGFLKFWRIEIEPYDKIERFFRIIKQIDNDYICKDDFVPLIQELLHFHPGLFFLEEHEEFQRKYALTVITRIFYKVNTSRTGKISLREVRHSNLLAEFMHVDEETDINRVTEYFSYEHFYVLYCKFFELDSDRDSKITREDLVKYAEHSLSETIVDRIFQVGTRVFSDGKEGGFKETGMTFPDFIFFMLSEEDKTTECALKYWFACCDLDGDGRLTSEELRYFYKTQLHRITSLGQENIQFADVLCQMIDLINPQIPLSLQLSDLTREDKRQMSGVLFDVIFNLHKFMRFETRDPFNEKQKREDAFSCDWDRYAHSEYHRLAQEEEGAYGMEIIDDAGDEYRESDIDEWSLDDDEDDDDRINRHGGGRGIGRK